MMHDTPLITTIVAGICLAFVFGTLAQRLRVPPLVGYMVAGIVVGPFTPGFVADLSLAPELAELGIILLMFGVGLHFSLKDLMSVRAIAIPGAILQIGFATLLGLGLGHLLGWSFAGGFIFGLALSVASTVVLLRALQDRRLIETQRGRIAIGWLVVEDLAMVLALVLLPPLAGSGAEGHGLAGMALWSVIAVTIAKVAAFIILMLVVGRKVIPWLLHYIAHTGSRELFRLAVLAIALGVAFGAARLFGVSLALGAFFAGLVLSESPLSHQAAQESLPLRDAFAVLFFVSVGMLFDPMILVQDPLALAATVFVIVIGKSAIAYGLVRLFGHPHGTALTISASLAQIGEFSFILADLGVNLHVLPEHGRSLILAGAILSILLNPLAFAALDWLRARLPPEDTAPKEASSPEPDIPVPTALSGHIVLVGYGRVGSLVGKALASQARPFLVIEDADKIVAGLRDSGIEVIVGNAARADILRAANLAGAARLVVAIPNAFEAGQVIEQARAANPGLGIVARAHSDAEVEHLRSLGAEIIVMGEREIARSMIEELTPQPAV